MSVIRYLGLGVLVLGSVLAASDPADARGRGFRAGFRPVLAWRAPVGIPVWRGRTARGWAWRHQRRGGSEIAFGGSGSYNDAPRYDRPACDEDCRDRWDRYDHPPERRWPKPKWISVADSPHVDAGSCSGGPRWVRTPYGWHVAGLCK